MVYYNYKQYQIYFLKPLMFYCIYIQIHLHKEKQYVFLRLIHDKNIHHLYYYMYKLIGLILLNKNKILF